MSFNTGGHVVYLQSPTTQPWALGGQTIFLDVAVLEGFLGDNILGFLSNSNIVRGALAVNRSTIGAFSEEPIIAPISSGNPLAGIAKTISKLLGKVSSGVTVTGTMVMSTGDKILGDMATTTRVAGTIWMGENSVAGDFSQGQAVVGSMSRDQSVVGEIT